MTKAEQLDIVIQHCRTIPDARALVLCATADSRNKMLALLEYLQIQYGPDSDGTDIVASVGNGKIILRLVEDFDLTK